MKRKRRVETKRYLVSYEDRGLRGERIVWETSGDKAKDQVKRLVPSAKKFTVVSLCYMR